MSLEKPDNNFEMTFSSKQEIEHNLPNHKALHKLLFETAFVLIKQERDRYNL